MNTIDVKNTVKLIDGTFTATEAKDVVSSLIKQKINFHKIHRLSIWEGNENGNTEFDDSRVAQLMRAQEDFVELCRELQKDGKRMKINGILEIEIID